MIISDLNPELDPAGEIISDPDPSGEVPVIMDMYPDPNPDK